MAIFVSIGIPSQFAEWCDAVVAELVAATIGPVSLIRVDTLEQAAVGMFKAECPNIVCCARHPDTAFKAALMTSGKPFIIAFEHPAAGFRYLYGHCRDVVAATRDIASSSAALLSMASIPSGMHLHAAQLNGEGQISLVRQIADRLGFEIGDDAIRRLLSVLDQRGITAGAGDDTDWLQDVEPSLHPLVLGALNGYLDHFASRGFGPLTWKRDLFSVGDEPSKAATGAVDVTGRARTLIYGPEIDLPLGAWTSRIWLGVSKEAAEIPYGIEITGGRQRELIARTSIRPVQQGIFETSLAFNVTEATSQPISLRIASERAAIFGRIALAQVTISPFGQPTVEIPAELSAALGI